ncbi:hypothetical protein IE4872_PD00229 (plasmid) [Rhizobium gallicum]|uniref:Uncharacterized protein n=1 Tax=Rhizobium gallicum TaxID=56730 RepID=A0A1L5NSB7_9HYPH|nr:hypothetical protein IE4872_PD00229 [Rhizobium gallicum]
MTRRSSPLSCRLGLTVQRSTEVAHRYDVTRHQIYSWRHELKTKGLLPSTAGTVFLLGRQTTLDENGFRAIPFSL